MADSAGVLVLGSPPPAEPEDGRTTSTGGWWLLFRSASREQRLDISLHVESAKMVRVVAWRTTDTPPLRDFVMKLTQREQAPLWRVNYLCVQSGMMRRELQLTLHATTGEVIGVVSSD